MPRRRILIILHQATSTPGRVGEMLVARGYQLDRRCPSEGDPLPERLDDYDASVVFGGPQSANDDHLPGIAAELRWLERSALPSGLPLLGICLGAQQMARVLGATVGPHPDGHVEIGYHPIHPTGACEHFMADAGHFYQWHSETFEIPRSAVHLAYNEAFSGQAFRYGECAYGIEFHPEMTREMVQKWCASETGSAKLALPGAQAFPEQLRDFDRHALYTDAWLDRFLDLLLGQRDDNAEEQTP
jgi:GMP synthase (glutamine-hydrolysing)